MALVVLATAVACRGVDAPPADVDAPSAVGEVSAAAPALELPPVQALAGLAVPFQENRGQWDPRVAFKADTLSGTVWVTTDGAIVHALVGAPRDVGDRAARAADAGGAPGSGWVLRERLIGGAAMAPRIVDDAAANVTYLIGRDPARWAPRVRTATRVSLGEPWPGVQVELQAHGGAVEKLFRVAPGADPSAIAVEVEGAQATRRDAAGRILAATGIGDVELSAPVAFQEVAGVRQPVRASYQVTARGYRFALGDYDRRRELVIDPIVQSTFLGGASDDSPAAMARASDGALVVVGTTRSPDFPHTTGYQPTHSAGSLDDMFIVRVNDALTTVLQATYLGGVGADRATALAIDAAGNVLVAGDVQSNDFPGTSGGAQPVYGGGGDMVIARLEPGLTSLTQATFLGGPSLESAVAMVVAPSGDVLVGGDASGTFPGTAGGAQASPAGNGDMVVARLNPTLTSLGQATFLGGTALDTLSDLALDASGDVLVGGATQSTAFPRTAGGLQPTALGNRDGVIARLTGGLTSLVQSTYFGGAANDRVVRVVSEAAGTVLVGATGSGGIPGTVGGAQPSPGGSYDMVLARLDASLASVRQATYLGGPGYEEFVAIARDPGGDLIVLGENSFGSGFPGTAGGIRATPAGSYDAVVARVDGALTVLGQATYLGCTGLDIPKDLERDPSGDLFVLGNTDAAAFPGTPGGAQAVNPGGGAVVSRLTGSLLAAPVPAAPVITAPVDGAILNTTSPVGSGTCVPGMSVRISDGASGSCTTTCRADGTFSCSLSTLGNGVHVLTAYQGDVPTCPVTTSPVSAAVTIVIDTVAPSAPAFTSPAAGSTVTRNPPDVAGTCETGTLVRVYDTVTLCTATCVASTFACTSAIPLANGARTIGANQTDPAGNTSNTTTLSFTMSAPVPPSITMPAPGSLTNDATPTVAGGCTAGLTVTVTEGGVPLCSAACAGTTYACATTALADGRHTIRATQVDGAGSSSAASGTVTFDVDTTAPAAPVIVTPAEGSSTNLREIRGSCETGAMVTVREGATSQGSASCAASAFVVFGFWAEGPHAITATQTDPVGNVSLASAVRTFTIDLTSPPAPTIATPAAGSWTSDTTPALTGTCETGATVTVRDSSTPVCTAVCVAGGYACTSSELAPGAHTVVASQRDPAGNGSSGSPGRTFTVDTAVPAAPGITAPAEGATVRATVAISGTCEDATIVTVREGATVVCAAGCAGTSFACNATTLADGVHAIAATQVDLAGNASLPSSTRSFTVDAVPPGPVTITAPTEDAVLEIRNPVVRGTCSGDGAVTVTVREGALLRCAAPCTGAAFECISTQVDDGVHTFVATAADPAGNGGTPSSPRTFTVDTRAPDAPTITAPADAASSIEARPPIAGTCETGAIVDVVRADGVSVCAAVPCGGGAFACSPAAPLPLGTSTLTATQTDRANHQSLASAPVRYTVLEEPAVVDPPVSDDGGCCAVDGAGPTAAWPALAVLGLLAGRRRRRGARFTVRLPPR
jgi:MYXO-CTERM domain-containing protein